RTGLLGQLDGGLQRTGMQIRGFQSGTEPLHGSDDDGLERIPLFVGIELHALVPPLFLDAEKRIPEFAALLPERRIVVVEIHRLERREPLLHLLLAPHEIQEQIVIEAARLESYVPQSVTD